ncbi:MAG: ribonuclease activity regulator RraA, partial [Mesorhizobium sp.]
EIAEECTGMESFEDFVLEEVRGGASIIGLYPCTKPENQERYEAWRKTGGR